MHRGKSSVVQIEKSGRKGQKGVALVMTLLLLLLLTGLSVVMVLSTNSDLMTNGYYRGFRGSFYASDSGSERGSSGDGQPDDGFGAGGLGRE